MRSLKTCFLALWVQVLIVTAVMIMGVSNAAAGTWLAAQADGGMVMAPEEDPHVPRIAVDWHDETGLGVTVELAGLELAIEGTKGGEFVVASCPETPLGGGIGEPALPVVRKLFFVPTGATVGLDVDEGLASPINLAAAGCAVPVMPMQAPILLAPGARENASFDYHDSAYAVDELLPAERVVVTELGIMRGQRLFLLEVRPLAYNPKRGELMAWPRIGVRITFQGGGSATSARAFMVPLQDIVLNPKPSGRGTGNYLIVMAEAYATTTPMTQFINAKTASGFNVFTYTVPLGTTRYVIKTYIESLWGTPDAPDYLLLVGDTDTIPFWWGQGDSGGGTDLPYACMDAGDDWIPDMAYGRFSVRSESDLQAMVDKTLFVEAGVFSDPDYARRAMFMAGVDTQSADEETHDWVIDTYMDPNDMLSEKLYMRTYGADTQDVRDAFNAGSVIGSFYGHSYSGIWQNGPPFSFADIDGLTNVGEYPFLFNFTCAVGAYHSIDTCFLEKWVRVADKGAVATIGTSNTIYAHENPGWPETSNLEKFLFDSIYIDGLHEVGLVWQAAMARLFTLYGAGDPVCRDYYEMFNLLGDPSLAIPEPAPPTENYLIITALDYANSEPLQKFTTEKRAQGYDVWVYKVASGTSREDIKAYIQGLWATANAPDYILIVGDTDGATAGANTIPHWVGQGSREAATDLPYACMDAGDDWYPDICIGRFSVRNVGQLKNVVDKTLFVEAGNFSDPDYVKRATFLATDDSTAQAAQTHDWVISTYLDPVDYEATRVYAAQGGVTADITAAVNNGSLFTLYFGHSSDSGWWTPAFDQADVNNLSNAGLFGLAFGWSCNTAHFTYDECFGETWLRAPNKGAAAYLSASNYVWWGSVESWESSRRMEKYFFESFFEDDIWRVGPAWQAALWRILDDPDFGPTHDHTRNIFEEFVLLGDPSLRLPQPDGFDLTPTPPARGLCSPPDTQTTYSIEVGLLGSFSEAVTLSAADEPSGASVSFDVNGQPPPFTSVMTADNLIGSMVGEYTIEITGTSASKQRAIEVDLAISSSSPATVTLLTPTDGLTGVSRSPNLTWQSSAGALEYDLEIATDSGFGNVIYSVTVPDVSHTVDAILDSLTEYFWRVRATNGCGDNGFSSPFSFTTLYQASYFTEDFSGGADSFDLENFTLLFQPDGSGNFYEMCGDGAVELPTDPAGGQTLSISEDGWGTISGKDLGGNTVQLYGQSYTGFYVNDNGSITFTSGDSVWQMEVTDHFSMPRISPAYDDFSVANGGPVSWKLAGNPVDRAVVTYEDVPQYNSTDSNTFQVEMFFDGDIRITWLGMDSNDPIVGLSAGLGVPAGYVETDLSAALGCFPSGACCFGETCTEMPEASCLGKKGEYLGEGTTCDPNPCATYESTCVIISEVVEGAESGSCPKWIEITNTGEDDFVFLEGGIIVQEDGDTDVTVDVDLSGVTILAGDSLVVNSNENGACTGAFPAIYSFQADINVELTSFGNGDDRYIITDTADGSNLLDIYGEFGVDGTGQPWEYDSGYAYREAFCNTGNDGIFLPSEWFFGGAGSLSGGNPTQLLLDNTTPGVHTYNETCTVGDPGDMNCDAEINGDDISAFVLALLDELAYEAAYPECDILNGDFTGDKAVTEADIALFIAATIAG